MLISLGLFLGIKSYYARNHYIYLNQSKAVEQLKKGNSFSFFSINLSESEKDGLDRIKTGVKQKELNNYGHLGGFLNEASSFFESLGNDQELSHSVAATLKKIVEDVVFTSGKDTAWVAIRVSPPNSTFNVPRWHTDGYYYPPYEDFVYKVVLTLKGPSTLLYDLPKKDRACFYEILDSSSPGIGSEKAMKVRRELAELLNDKSRLHVPPLYAGIAFIAGDRNKAAVHSEPQMKSERIFISILPGTQEEIDSWGKNK